MDTIMTRKIIQIQVAATIDSCDDKYDDVYALCDDGSVWRILSNTDEDRLWDTGWHMLPPLPPWALGPCVPASLQQTNAIQIPEA
jgi:hypothetical protein